MSEVEKFSRLDFRDDRFVHYSLANDAINEMKFIYDLSGRNKRPVNLALIGEGGCGKTSFIHQFLSSTFAWEPAYSQFGFQQNISYFDLPPRVTRNKLLNNILNPKDPSERRISLGDFVIRAEEMNLKLIIIDEFSELDRTNKNYKHEVLHTMKWIGNNLKIPFIVAGTDAIEPIFSGDPQMGRRFKIIELCDWKSGKEFEYFVYSYLKSLPGFEQLDQINQDLFDLILGDSSSASTQDVIVTLSDAAYEAFMKRDVENVHIYARQLQAQALRLRMRSGDANKR